MNVEAPHRAPNVPLVDGRPDLTGAETRISALIESLKAGTYDASAWDVPF
jgi:hypothetical protein